MAKDPNLNTRITGDASGINAAAKSAKSAVRDFSRTTEQAMSSLGDVFGVNTGKIEQLTNAAKGLGVKLTSSSNEGVAAFGKLLGSVNAVSMGIAGLGIGAAVAAFKTLNAEADNFKQTVAGANFEMQTAAYLSTYSQVLHDLNSETGKDIQSWKNRMKEMWAQVKGGATTFVVGGVTTSSVEKWGQIGAQAAIATGKAERAKVLAGEIWELELKRLNTSTDMLHLDDKIAEKQLIIRDTQKSTAERAEALAEAEELIKQKYAAQREIEGGIYQRMQEIDDLAENTLEETKATIAQKNKVESLNIAEKNELKALLRVQNSITSAAQAEANARENALKALQKQETSQVIKDIQMSSSKLDLSNWAISAKEALGKGKAVDTSGLMGFENYGAQIEKFKDYSQEASAVVVDCFSSMSESVGTFFADLANGEDAFKNLGNNALSAFGGMMETVGKLVLKEGIAVSAVWASLSNPASAPLAITAGAALIAIGAAIKAGLSNAASGSYSASSSVATGGYTSSSSTSSNYGGRELNVHVTGTLQAKGSTLQAVLNNEAKRQISTT